ncbi:MAG: hypothetical protein Q8S24_10820 [Eubacteriales bacterium]|nr:hypothetical protein [Eubacteriales bacterium]
MRLITESGEMVLPSDFSISIEQKSPFFSDEGTQSIPVTLPEADINNSVLGHASRPGHTKQFKRKISATLETSAISKSGKLVIENVQKNSGTIAALMLNESDFYTQIKDVRLSEVFSKKNRNEFSSVQNIYEHIFNCMTGEIIDDFTMFPVACNLNEGKYSLLNGPDTKSNQDPWPLKWSARRIYYENQAVNVPDGYGITPFLWLHKAIDLLFYEYGYSVRKNPFRDGFLSQIVLINNTADSICKGSLNYGDLVPSCSVAEFIKFLELKFLCFCFITPESKTVDIIPLNEAVKSVPDQDISRKVDGSEKYIFSEPQEVDIKSETSLEGAQPAMETLFDLANKYTHIASLNEFEFRNNAWKYNFIFRQSTGEYYEVLRKPGTSSVQINKLGTNYFRHYTKRLTAKEYISPDVMPTMVELKMGVNGSKEIIIVCPYIGQTRHMNTSYKEKGSSADLKIMIALCAGMSDYDANIDSKYYVGTTQRYNNLGNICYDYDLTPQSIYQLFFKGWNEYLMNSGISAECKVDFLIEDLLSLKMDRPKLIKGQPVLLQELSYNIGERLTNTVSKYILLKKLSPEMVDIQVSFLSQDYTWEYQSNIDSLLAEFDTQEWESYTWDYIGDDIPGKNSFEYIPPPTISQFQSGETYYSQQNTIKIIAYKLYNQNPFIYEKTLISGFKAVQI